MAESRRCTRRLTTQNRNALGQFTRTEVSNVQVQAERRNRRQRRVANLLIGKRMFEKLAELVFLHGDEEDFVPADGSSPLCIIPAKLLKDRFLPSEQERVRHFRFLYFEKKEGTRQQDVKVSRIVDGSSSAYRLVRRRVYRGRRLPDLGKVSSEMRPIKKWIHGCIEKGMLKTETLEAAFEVFREELSRYSVVRGKRFYKGYPVRKSRPEGGVQDMEGRTIEAQEGREAGMDGGGNEDVQNNPSIRTSVAEAQYTTEFHGPFCAGCSILLTRANRMFETGEQALNDYVITGLQSNVNEEDMNLNEEDMNLSAEMAHTFATARDDNMFFLLCNAVDDGGGSKLHLIGHTLLTNCRRSILSVDAQVRDMIQYVVDGHFGNRGRADFLELEKRVLLNIKSLKLARSCLGLPRYEDMHWNDIIGSNVEVRMDNARAGDSNGIRNVGTADYQQSGIRNEEEGPMARRADDGRVLPQSDLAAGNGSASNQQSEVPRDEEEQGSGEAVGSLGNPFVQGTVAAQELQDYRGTLISSGSVHSRIPTRETAGYIPPRSMGLLAVLPSLGSNNPNVLPVAVQDGLPAEQFIAGNRDRPSSLGPQFGDYVAPRDLRLERNERFISEQYQPSLLDEDRLSPMFHTDSVSDVAIPGIWD